MKTAYNPIQPKPFKKELFYHETKMDTNDRLDFMLRDIP